MNELKNVAGETKRDDDDLVCVGEFGVLDRLRKHAKEVLKRDESSGARCRYPDHIRMLCKHIGAREDIKISKIYPALVKVGYGIKYRDHKNGDNSMSDVVGLISGMRASDNPRDRTLEDVISGVILFNGGNRVFRYDNNFVAETSDYAEKLNVHVLDLYMYYCLVGLNEICDLDEYMHLKDDIGRIKMSYELKKTDANFKFAVMFMGEFI